MSEDICTKTRKQIEKHREAIENLRSDLDSYVGTAKESQVGSDPENIHERIHLLEEKIQNLQELLSHNGC
ncbi:hypothetical protein [Desulforamulus aquiferis]|uniref:Uncharacterized protein n=1 Tax=Desulforamulus aquiferis TaxID=1397668 RepID=A0AAW7ZBT1_9FIRM|nr:hypothetical protein [Desulforamulus aquiferis]MDO7787142.1 hypothetical protein [Desulforamulus aquiferis]